MIKRRQTPSLNPNPIPEPIFLVSEADRQKAREWLQEKHDAGELAPFEDLPDENPLDLYIDMLGLNGRKMRDTVKASAGDKFLRTRTAS